MEVVHREDCSRRHSPWRVDDFSQPLGHVAEPLASWMPRLGKPAENVGFPIAAAVGSSVSYIMLIIDRYSMNGSYMPDQNVEEVLASFPPFAARVGEPYRVTNDALTTLQANIGYRCNLVCRHCHLGCSPAREEEMDRATMQACLDAYAAGRFKLLDITGGAPEMNPDLEWLLDTAHEMGIPTVVRTNLCILLEPECRHFIDVYVRDEVHLYASLPFYAPGPCDKIRGNGTFMANIEVIRQLNKVGYGTGDLPLTFVFSPAGPMLPPDKGEMEREYRRRLKDDFDVEFTDLVMMTNMPCGRFAETLNGKGRLGKYVEKLIGAFNPDTVPTMMCRDQVSIDWRGRLYDCDFNQAMGVPTPSGETIFDWVNRAPQARPIAFRNWCYACTAGAGSS
jgi:radical SAM/Cys-rich protein